MVGMIPNLPVSLFIQNARADLAQQHARRGVVDLTRFGLRRPSPGRRNTTLGVLRPTLAEAHSILCVFTSYTARTRSSVPTASFDPSH